MLPTLIFILGAYLLYALFTAWPRRHNGHLRARRRWRRFGRLTLAGGLGLGLGLILWFFLSPDPQQRDLKLAGFLGTGWAEGWLGQADRRLEYPQVKSQGPGDQPVYALLHPETPPTQLSQEKKPAAPRPLRKPGLQKSSSQGKGGKSLAQPPKKERVATKPRLKKKKPESSPAGQKGTSG